MSPTGSPGPQSAAAMTTTTATAATVTTTTSAIPTTSITAMGSPSRDFASEPSESSFSSAVADAFSNHASLNSTPPTTTAESVVGSTELSELSETTETPKPEFATPQPDADALLDVSLAVHSPSCIPADISTSNQASVDASGRASGPAAAARARRLSRPGLPVYNLSKLSGTAHNRRRTNGDQVLMDRKRRATSGQVSTPDSTTATLTASTTGAAAGFAAAATTSVSQQVQAGVDALKMNWDIDPLKTPKPQTSKKSLPEPTPSRRFSTRSSRLAIDNVTHKISTLGKRSRKTFEKGMSRMARELLKLQDTNEFAGIDTKPVVYTTWAKGKFIAEDDPGPARKKTKVCESSKDGSSIKGNLNLNDELPIAAVTEPAVKKSRKKKWLDCGLYAGQEPSADRTKGLTAAEKKALAVFPKLAAKGESRKVLPTPMYNGLRLLLKGRNYKLPYDICNPLPPGQPKPVQWKHMTKNRFVGDAAAYWKKTPHFKDYQSKCVCTPEDGCGESCQNRIMLYECDTTNCNVGADLCQNRAFARLAERTKMGGKYRVGVEVLKTEDRGYGIRCNRSFEPNQIIMEYTGEIITEAECDRRMSEKYKNNECYYLMLFDQNMIIDATSGSIARFVNHSCNPNCRMIKWIVSGQPRMALFAGDRPIQTGEELTYDYNFDPFSKNVQKCLCGAENCRGVLGPRPKEVKPPKISKDDIKSALKKGVRAGKRKLKDVLDDDENALEATTAKKRKTKSPKSPGPQLAKHHPKPKAKSSFAAARLKAAVKKASKTVKSTISIKTKKTIASSKTTTIKSRQITSMKKSTVVKTYGRATPRASQNDLLLSDQSPPRSNLVEFTAHVNSDSDLTELTDVSSVEPESSVLQRIYSNEGDQPTSPTQASDQEKDTPSPRKGVDIPRACAKIRLVSP